MLHRAVSLCDPAYLGVTVYCLPFQIERYVKHSLGGEMAKMQQNAVHTQTAAILDLSTNLISQTAQHTRKLTDVETQVQ